MQMGRPVRLNQPLANQQYLEHLHKDQPHHPRHKYRPNLDTHLKYLYPLRQGDRRGRLANRRQTELALRHNWSTRITMRQDYRGQERTVKSWDG